MKILLKNLILGTLLLIQLQVLAQIEVKQIDGTPINDGSNFLFFTNSGNGAYLNYKVYNTSSTPTIVKIKCVSITNASGGDVQLCFGGVCFGSITAGNSYPDNPDPIDGNGENGNFDHFYNNSSGISPTADVLYTFKFYQVDANGTEVGNSVTFGYQFVQNLTVADIENNSLKKFGVEITSNSVQNQLEMQIFVPMTTSIFDLNGRLVLTKKMDVGQHILDVSLQKSGMYLIKFVNETGQNVVAKCLKK